MLYSFSAQNALLYELRSFFFCLCLESSQARGVNGIVSYITAVTDATFEGGNTQDVFIAYHFVRNNTSSRELLHIILLCCLTIQGMV